MTTALDNLYRELDQWNFNGDEVMLWWRDDDAVESTPELARLLDLADRYDVPLALAVIPQSLQPDLSEALAGYRDVAVLQHGISHQNNAPEDCKKQELISQAGVEQLSDRLADSLATGFGQLTNAFAERFCPVLVPPWNRIDSALFPLLGGIGFRGLSCFQPRQSAEVSDQVWLVNTHVDIINWKQGRTFIGEQVVVEQMVSHLRVRRLGEVDAAEPTGLLTHHLVHDEESWHFLDQLLDALDQHPAVTWLSAERVFQTRWR